MSNKKLNKTPGSTVVMLNRPETLMLWQLINSPAVATRPADGRAANALYDKLKKAVDETGGVPVPATPGGESGPQQA